MLDPPLSVGADHETSTLSSPGVPAILLTAPGATRGVAGSDGNEYRPLPAALTAATLNVYAVPLMRPVTVWVSNAEADARTKEVHVVEIHDCTS